MPIIAWYLIVTVSFPGILMIVDAAIAYKRGSNEPQGIPGFRRSIIALTVLLVLGIAIFHLLIEGSFDSRKIAENMLSVLTGVVATTAGFYFGGRSSEEVLD